MPHKIAFVTVIYENYTVLTDLFASFRKQTDQDYHLFLVDSSRVPNKIPINDHLTILHVKNKGYAHGINHGLKAALGENYDRFVVINSDIFFEKDFVKNIKSSIERNTNAIVGGKIYYAPGYEFHMKRYSKKDLGHVLWYAGGAVDWNHALTPHRGVDEVDHGQYDQESSTGFINGCFMSFHKSTLDTVGFWNEKYFLYFEDSDYCERAKKKDIKLIYDPSLVLWHKNAQSTGGSGSKTHEKYQRINQLRFGLTFAPIKTKLHLVKNFLFS